MKTCSYCGIEKPLSEFPRRQDSKDGHRKNCKDCRRKEQAAVWKKRHDYYLAKHAAYRQTDTYKKSRPTYDKTYNQKHPDRRRARIAVGHAIRAGRLIRQPCEVCGDPKSQAHHPDYSKPLEVKWLCATHHVAEHGRSVLQNYA